MRVEGNYYECLCKRKSTVKGYMIRGGLGLLAALFIIAGLFITPFLLFIGLAGCYLIYLANPRFNVTYEYVFCDGQIDFDKILGGEGRKHVARVDMDSVDMIAPLGSHALDGFMHQNPKLVDYSSLIRDENHKVYVIINKGKTGLEQIYFEPDQTMLTLMKQKSPRKVNEY